jgi:hypothetical protein
MYHTMVCPAEAAFFKDGIRIGYEIAIGEKEKLDNLEVDETGIFQWCGHRFRLCCFRASLSCHLGIPFNFGGVREILAKICQVC